MSYKLFVADMDGTLLNDNKELSDKDIQTIKKLQDFGIKFAVATGRHDSMIKSYLKHLDLHVPVISCNGAIVREPFSDQIFLSQTLPKEQSLQVVDICKESNVGFHIYGHESIFGEKLNHKMLYYHNLNKTLPSDERTKLVVVPDCKDIVINEPEPLYKFLIISEESQDLLDIIEHLSELDGLTVTQSMPMLCDVMKTGITKAYALQRLSESLGIKREGIAAIGDQHNDIDLIEYAGLGIAVANAEDALKAKADIVTTSTNNENAVSEAIENFLLN
ncbi:MAG: HAD family phosphatase [bacterium]|nr:HAD family phosphatase [bacterium]